MIDAYRVKARVEAIRGRNTARDSNYKNLIAIRKGDYDSVAPGLFNDAEFGRPLVANLIDTTARDLAEVMAPLPAVNCQSASMASQADRDRQDLRAAIANGYVQHSRLQDQMFGGADRYGSFGFLAYVVEPDFTEKMPCIRVNTTATTYYSKDYLGRTTEYFEVSTSPACDLADEYPELGLKERLGTKFGAYQGEQQIEVVRWIDGTHDATFLPELNVVLDCVEHKLSRCPVRVVERPDVTNGGPRGQFDDVIWVQVARALVQMYTMNALERSVNAPVVLPNDVQELELGPFAAIRTDNPQGVGTVPLNISPGLFPEQQMLAQEQRLGSRYPEGRSGSIDASIITGQGVQALMGTFDTQVQTFQRLNSTALEDVMAICFEMDQLRWGNTKKTRRIKDNGAPREYTYTPAKDIKDNFTTDVSYGTIAGLDPNRALVFTLQALAGGLISKTTARKSLPVQMNVDAEGQQIDLEHMDESIAASLAALPQAIPQMAMSGVDPRELALQVVKARDLVAKGKSVSDAIQEVFAPKQVEDPQAAAPPPAIGAPGAAGAPQDDASQMLMMLSGMSPSGANPQMSANVSSMQPVA